MDETRIVAKGRRRRLGDPSELALQLREHLIAAVEDERWLESSDVALCRARLAKLRGDWIVANVAPAQRYAVLKKVSILPLAWGAGNG